jgi:hypothetical protein
LSEKQKGNHVRPDIIIDPAKGSIRLAPSERRFRRIPDRLLRATLLSVKRDRKALNHKRFIYDRKGSPLGVVTFEPCDFDPYTGKRRHR